VKNPSPSISLGSMDSDWEFAIVLGLGVLNHFNLWDPLRITAQTSKIILPSVIAMAPRVGVLGVTNVTTMLIVR